ncbi:MAG TPA: Mut7-C RNAse domain-containing protein [Burkholderiaceae bacterium]|nr:Mut7-C RNAse domain-containing protein [Burkholderiaceae bacterium]
MATARFRFYEELNDFLAPRHRRREFDHPTARAATVKHAIEALGVPHTEVELILVNGESVDFSTPVRDGDRISVYPMFESLDIAPLLRVRPQPLRVTRFVADAHLGALARLLRMCGFDARYDNGFTDDEVRRLAREERRIVLTRDRELLKARSVTHGCYVHSVEPAAQLREVLARLQLAGSLRPFSRCLHCNLELVPVPKRAVLAQLPEEVARTHDRFRRCDGCARVYWEGSHWRRMQQILCDVLPDPALQTTPPEQDC